MSKLGVAIGISPSFGTGQEGGGISYLLFDDFLSALTAGNVDGTDAEPTGGERIVNGQLYITGGELVAGAISTTGITNNYIEWSQTIPSIKGRILMAVFEDRHSSGNFSGAFFGTPGLVTQGSPGFGMYYGNSTAYMHLGSIAINIGSYSRNVSQVSTVLFGTGRFFLYAKISGVHRLVGIGTVTIPDPFTFRIWANDNNGTEDGYWDFAKVPTDLYLPTPVYSDGFSNANLATFAQDSGDGNYHLPCNYATFTGTHMRQTKLSPSGAAGISFSSALADQTIIDSTAYSYAVQFRRRAQVTYGTLFRMDKVSGGHYSLIQYNQYGNGQMFFNTSSFYSIGGLPDLHTLSVDTWYGYSFTYDETAGATGEAKLYYAGSQIGTTQTGIAGTSNTANWDTNTTLGFGGGGTGRWNGDIRHGIITINGVVMTTAQAQALSDPSTVITKELLDGYFGAGNYVWYKMDDVFTSDGLGHAETSGLGAGGNGKSLVNGLVNGANARMYIQQAISNNTNLISDPSLDGTYNVVGATLSIPPGWSNYNADDATDTIAKDTTNYQINSGTASCHITVDAANEGIQYPATGLTAGVWYEFGAMFERTSGTYQIATSTLALGDRSRTSTKSSWYPLAIRFMLSGTTVNLIIASSGGGADFKPDNTWLRQADLSSFLAGHDYGYSDVYCSVEVTTNGEEGCGLFALCDSLSAPTEMVYALVDSVASNVSLVQMVAGISTVQATTAITYSAGTKLVLITNDTSGGVRCYYGSKLIGSFTRNAALSGNTIAGLFSISPEPYFDNLVIYDTTSADSELSKYD